MISKALAYSRKESSSVVFIYILDLKDQQFNIIMGYCKIIE